jgi:hypothetical protein
MTSAAEERKKAYARWAADGAEESERRRQEGKVAIWLDRGPGDAETFTKELQAELYAIVDPIRLGGVDLEAPFLAADDISAVSGYVGQLIVPLAQIASPLVAVALVAWIKGRAGRKARMEFHPDGRLKMIEAQTPEEVISMFKAVEPQPTTKGGKRRPARNAK